MNKLTIITAVIVISTFLTIAKCGAVEFTVDKRSMLHVGGSALLDASCNGFSILVTGKNTNGQRAFCGVATFSVGLVKEFVIDGYPDYGDIFMNGLGMVISDQTILHFFPVENGGGIGFTGRY